MGNTVIMTGNVGNKPDLRHLPSGRAAMTISLATHREIPLRNPETRELLRDDKGKVKTDRRTDWSRWVMYGPRAEGLHPHITRGRGLHLEGRQQTREYLDKDGNRRWVTENIVQVFEFTSSGNGGRRDEIPPVDLEEPIEVPDDDIPF